MRNKYRVDKIAEHCNTIKKGKRQIDYTKSKIDPNIKITASNIFRDTVMSQNPAK